MLRKGSHTKVLSWRDFKIHYNQSKALYLQNRGWFEEVISLCSWDGWWRPSWFLLNREPQWTAEWAGASFCCLLYSQIESTTGAGDVSRHPTDPKNQDCVVCIGRRLYTGPQLTAAVPAPHFIRGRGCFNQHKVTNLLRSCRVNGPTALSRCCLEGTAVPKWIAMIFNTDRRANHGKPVLEVNRPRTLMWSDSYLAPPQLLETSRFGAGG